ncbi:MAG: arginine--tRNA ligase [Eubacteriales bacterium]|nr:arginine--tRNA ligase [Eubacteriales bacterium]
MDYKNKIAEAVAAAVETETPENLAQWIEIPPDRAMGDYAFPCFKLARILRKAPPVIAADLAARVRPEGFSRVEAVGGYLNFFVEKGGFAAGVLSRILSEGERYGSSDRGQGRVVCIDYSSINIAKRFHIGHLSTTMIGNALYKIYTFCGYRCVGINHLGDWGTQFGKMIAGFLRWGSREQVEKDGVDELVRLYVMADKDPDMQEEGRAWFKKIEEGDAQAMEIFRWFKEITLRDAERVYAKLGVRFDSYAGESFYNDKMGRVIDELKAKNLLVESNGAQVVMLDEYGLPPALILKADGATLYVTRDLAAALYRRDTYHFDKCLYVVAYQQDMHFRQLFKVLELMGYEWAATDLEHVSFGMVSYEGETLSTRRGHVVYLDDLLDRSVEKARAIIEEKSPDLENKDAVAASVGIGSVVFFTLLNSRIKDIDFWWDRALNFDGETGPYTQYTHARCCSVLRKADLPLEGETDWSALSDEEAQSVITELARFGEVVSDALERNEPSIVTRFTVGLAQKYNAYYFAHRILDGAPEQSRARLILTEAVRTVLKTGLSLIGVDAPERM